MIASTSNKEVGQVDWNASFEGKSVVEMWTRFKTTLTQLCVTHDSRAMPRCRQITYQK